MKSNKKKSNKNNNLRKLKYKTKELLCNLKKI